MGTCMLEWDIPLARILLREGRVFGRGCERQWAPECVRNGRPWRREGDNCFFLQRGKKEEQGQSIPDSL